MKIRVRWHRLWHSGPGGLWSAGGHGSLFVYWEEVSGPWASWRKSIFWFVDCDLPAGWREHRGNWSSRRPGVPNQPSPSWRFSCSNAWKQSPREGDGWEAVGKKGQSYLPWHTSDSSGGTQLLGQIPAAHQTFFLKIGPTWSWRGNTGRW